MTSKVHSGLTAPLHLERALLALATAFLILLAVALTLAPAARLRTWDVDYRWLHWTGVLVWVLVFWSARWLLQQRHPDHDPFLLPVVGLLTGWGLLTIFRLTSPYGLRQTIWLGIAGGVLLFGLRRPNDLSLLRRYKYLWLTAGLALTAATLFLGTNPLGVGPRLWLGCCGVYLQPSEPLKLLLVIYLAAYLADRLPAASAAHPPASHHRLSLYTLGPTLVLTGLALLLLVVQRDLGTASIFLFLYAAVVTVATRDIRIPLLSLLALIAAALIGYVLFDVVQLRIEAWLNPWLDPSGRSYQIVQSLLAVANGGLIGRGPGLGNPGLVPIAQSDFIFAAISEEFGLAGALGMLLLLGLLLARGLRAALSAPDAYRRLLAAGLTIHLTAQSILIIGGNLRLLPLTGVTLPFVSYGGSSLLVAFLELLCLLHISAASSDQTVPIAGMPFIRRLSLVAFAGLAAAALVAGWWGFVRGPDLLTRSDNARRSIADRIVQRGSLIDRSGQILAESQGQTGDFLRVYPYAPLATIVGYTDPVYGQSGLEFSLDSYLRGLQGYPALTLWQNHLLYGMPPPGLDVRISLYLPLQQAADLALGDQPGALVLLNAQSGEILAIASHPTFDANTLEQDWPGLVEDPASPLFNRAADGLYPLGAALAPFMLAEAVQSSSLPLLPSVSTFSSDGITLDCASQPAGSTWGASVASGCPTATIALTGALGTPGLLQLMHRLALFTAPELRLPAQTGSQPSDLSDPVAALLNPGDATNPPLVASPLQMALAAAVLSNQGIRPAPLLVMAVDTPQSGWVMLPSSSAPEEVFTAETTRATANQLADTALPIWQTSACVAYSASDGVCWYLGGTLDTWAGAPLAVAVLLEELNPALVTTIGHDLLESALTP